MVTEARRIARRFAGPGALALGLALAGPTAAAEWPSLRIVADSVTTADVRVEGLAAELRPDGSFEVNFAQLGGAGGAVLLEATAVAGRLDELGDTQGRTVARGALEAWGLAADWSLATGAEGFAVELVLTGQPCTTLAALPGAPDALAWLQGGSFDAVLRLDAAGDQPPAWEGSLDVRALGFDSPEGRFAGVGLAFMLQARGSGPALDGAALTARIERGELLLDRLYRRFDGAPVEIGLDGRAAGGGPVLDVRLRDPGAVQLDATLSWPGAPGIDPEVEVRALELEFPGAYGRYLESIAAAWDLDGLEVTGRVDWEGAWQGGELRSGDLDIRDLSVVDTRLGRFALTGLETRLKPGDRAFESRIGWRGLMLGRINLGAGTALLDAEPGLLSLGEPLVLDVMGGQLRLDAFRYALPGARPAAGRDTYIRASLHDIELLPLTRALGWPEFGGRLNGDLPGAHLEDGVLSVDGGIAVEVFGGAVQISDLRVERLFGVLPSLAANIELRDLDLEQLTETFSFGRIGGRVDGYVHDLRMLDWTPVAFDAWLGTPERQRGTNGISRQAVNHLASIGGGGAAAVLSGPMLRFFNNFSYRRLGLGCRLDNHVCAIRGLADDGSGVLLLEGAGMPRITIRAYNRAIDWPQMIANLVAVSEGESIEFGPGSNP